MDYEYKEKKCRDKNEAAKTKRRVWLPTDKRHGHGGCAFCADMQTVRYDPNCRFS